MDCSCQRHALCDDCLDRYTIWLSGIAGSRGWSWADHVARQHLDLLVRPWPVTRRTVLIARRKVDDIARDPRLERRLTRSCIESAVRRWRMLQQQR